MNEVVYKQTVFILVPVSKVWDALINPEITPQYMFGCVIVSDWSPGNPVVWKSVLNGTEYAKGNLETFDSEKELSFRVFDVNSGYVDDPVNYLLTTYKLFPIDNGTKLEISQGNFATVENGEKRYQEAVINWEITLSSLKRLLEA